MQIEPSFEAEASASPFHPFNPYLSLREEEEEEETEIGSGFLHFREEIKEV